MHAGRFALVLAVIALVFSSGPVAAQIVDPGGFTIPWFRSAAERRAREACEQNLPDCRAAVRQEIARERQASLVTPWLVLGGAVLAVLFWLRARERKREKKRVRAQRRHDPNAYRNIDKTRAERDEAAAEEHNRMS